jgi:hypothetical protein
MKAILVLAVFACVAALALASDGYGKHKPQYYSPGFKRV